MRELQVAELIWGLSLWYHPQLVNKNGLVKSVASVAIGDRKQSWCVRELDQKCAWEVCVREVSIRSGRCGKYLDSGAPPRKISVGCRNVGCD